MIDYLVDDNFDIVLPLQKVTSASDLLFQQVKLLLNTWQGEFPYDVRMGIGYEQKILGLQSVDVTEIEIEYFKKISVLQFFKSMNNFSVSLNANRELLISFSVTSTENQIEIFNQVV